MSTNLRPPIYDQEAVQPMRDELVAVGFEEARTPTEVETIAEETKDKTVLYLINSVCGCAAGSARPGVALALQHATIPDRLVTVFAGQERDAVDAVRNLAPNEPPSSPSVFLFKNGEPVFMLPRYLIEGRSKEQISMVLKEAFDKHCERKGPSISVEDFEKVERARACGSKIPLHHVS